MSTSVLDYIFRELAISYLGRHDLAHVAPEDLAPDTTGKGETQSDVSDAPTARVMQETVRRVASKGYVRSLTVLPGGMGGGKPSQGGGAGGGVQGATALAMAPQSFSVAEVSYGQETLIEEEIADETYLRRLREARLKGYEGDNCGECGNFTLVRNGTCLKCDTCGGTSGCS
jgi:ribonucleoside-diphosphate reductase alpha chain